MAFLALKELYCIVNKLWIKVEDKTTPTCPLGMNHSLRNPLSVEMRNLIGIDEILHSHRALGSKGHSGRLAVDRLALTGCHDVRYLERHTQCHQTLYTTINFMWPSVKVTLT